MQMIPSKYEVEKAYKSLKPHVHLTPVLTSDYFNRRSGTELFFKCENFQRMGAFKMRGALYVLMQLDEQKRAAGVITHSSGNFAQALSLAAKMMGIKAHIVMPHDAPEVKKEAVREYGGIIYETGSASLAREKEAERIRIQKGLTFIHPSNNRHVILGNATAAMEFIFQKSDLDYIVIPIGGGGLAAGTALAVAYYGENCQTIGAEPFEADDAYRSLLWGKIEYNKTANTVADGLRTFLGDENFPIIKKHVSKIIRVEEKEITDTMKNIWERMKIIVEPSSAVALAAVLREKIQFQNKKTGIILSGGNVDLKNLPF